MLLIHLGEHAVHRSSATNVLHAEKRLPMRVTEHLNAEASDTNPDLVVAHWQRNQRVKSAQRGNWLVGVKAETALRGCWFDPNTSSREQQHGDKQAPGSYQLTHALSITRQVREEIIRVAFQAVVHAVRLACTR
jgi:hypothetical protein